METFRLPEYQGEIAVHHRPGDLPREIRQLLNPAAALRTLHWGRNYIYAACLNTPAGPLPVAVKQFRNDGWRERLRKPMGRSKARKSWRVGRALQDAGIGTPEPVLVADSNRPGGPSFYVSRLVEGGVEARYLLRSMNQGREGELFPEIPVEEFLETLGRMLRRLHDAGFWHRDMSMGNILMRRGEGGELALYLVDLNRTRMGRPPTVSERTRDLCRLALPRREHREILLRSYWGERPRGMALKRALYSLYSRGFQLKNRLKAALRQGLRRIGGWILPQRPYPHIPEPPPDASRRDRVVWDFLSDQPHHHAGRLEKLALRLADARIHAEELRVVAAALPRIWCRYRRLNGEIYRRPVAWGGVGVCLRPWPEDPEGLLAAVEELGVRHLLLRLHPWETDHAAEVELARELCHRSYELTLALPQSRELVKDLRRWEEAVREIAEVFTPYSRRFQVGQAINRSKWGVWNAQEYVELFGVAAAVLRRDPEVELLGPAVIDFEFHRTAALLNLSRPGLFFDAVASLLYVDRRGAPENSQARFDTVDKVVLLRAIAETARNSTHRCWVTEVNWPLWEGPHAPAGRSVAVDEETQADYLVRYYLLVLGTGLVERVFWWQLVAKGYGLIDPAGWRRRPSFRALATLERELRGRRFHGPLPAPGQARLYRFQGPGGEELVVGWSPAGEERVELPSRPLRVVGRDGEDLPLSPGRGVVLTASPRYFYLEESG